MSQDVPPNVLMIAVDDMNDWVGCLNGYPGVQTPNIDRLASEGVLFINAHCPSPKCGPSRTAIMTGLRPSTTGIYDNNQWWAPNLPRVKTIPMYFKEHGYQVLGAGKIFHHTAGNNPPDQWHDYFRIVFDDPWDRAQPGQNTAPWVEYEELPAEIPLNRIRPFKHEFDWGSLNKEQVEYGDAQAVDWAIGQLRRAHENPFFLAVGLFHPHLPWYAPPEYFDRYPIDEIILPEVPDYDLDDIPEVGLQLARAGRQDFEKVKAHEKWAEAVQAYLASISFADDLVGQLLAALAASDHADNTLVVFWSDHGWHLGEKQHWHKSTLWERATHIPFIIKEPGVRGNRRITSPINLLDLFPTLVERCGLPSLAPLEGNSLVPMLCGAESADDTTTLITFLKGNHALRSTTWKYIRYHDGGEELYNLMDDPNEWSNLASGARYAGVKASFVQRLPAYDADAKPTKSAFNFDYDTYTWTKKQIKQ